MDSMQEREPSIAFPKLVVRHPTPQRRTRGLEEKGVEQTVFNIWHGKNMWVQN